MHASATDLRRFTKTQAGKSISGKVTVITVAPREDTRIPGSLPLLRKSVKTLVLSRFSCDKPMCSFRSLSNAALCKTHFWSQSQCGFSMRTQFDSKTSSRTRHLHMQFCPTHDGVRPKSVPGHSRVAAYTPPRLHKTFMDLPPGLERWTHPRLGRHLLHRQDQQHGAVRGHQLHVPLVPPSEGFLHLSGRCRTRA